MNDFEEYVQTHHQPLLTALAIARTAATDNDRGDDANYWQHEINALIEVIRKLPKK